MFLLAHNTRYECRDGSVAMLFQASRRHLKPDFDFSGCLEVADAVSQETGATFEQVLHNLFLDLDHGYIHMINAHDNIAYRVVTCDCGESDCPCQHPKDLIRALEN